MSGLHPPSNQSASQPDQPPRQRQADIKVHDVPGTRYVRRTVEWGKKKYAGSWAEYLWHRLDAADFMNQALLLAATLGLTHQAAADVGHLFNSASATSNAVTGLSWVFFIVAGIAAATQVQRLYQRVFGQDPRGPRDRLPVLIWLALTVGWFALDTSVGPGFRASAPVLWWIVSIPVYIGFWWSTMWLLLARRVSWRRLVITLGAATGLMWQDRGMSFGAAVRKLRRGS